MDSVHSDPLHDLSLPNMGNITCRYVVRSIIITCKKKRLQERGGVGVGARGGANEVTFITPESPNGLKLN